MSNQTLFGKGLEEISSEDSKRETRIKGEEDWLVFAVPNKDKAKVNPDFKHNFSIPKGPQQYIMPMQFYALTPRNELKQLTSFDATWTESNNRVLEDYLNDFCGFNGKIYLSTNEVDWGHLSTLEKDRVEKVRSINGRMQRMCSDGKKISILGERYDDDNLGEFYNEQVVVHINEHLRMVGSDIIRGISLEGLNIIPHEGNIVAPRTLSYDEEGNSEWLNEEGVLSYEGRLFYFTTATIEEDKKNDIKGLLFYELVDQNRNALLAFELPKREGDGVGSAEVFNGKLYLPGYFSDKSQENRGVAVYARDSVLDEESLEQYLKKNPECHVVGSSELELILPEHNVHSFKKVKYKDLAYLLEKK